MLSDIEELELSDRIVAMRSISDSCKSDGREPTNEEQVTIDDGIKACSELVEHYLPYIKSTAYSVFSKIKGGSEETRQELIQVASTAALRAARSYNLRGKDGRAFRGIRFARYSTMSMLKAMYLHLGSQNTSFYVSQAAILSSWKWNSAKSELTQRLGRVPTPDEIEQETGINKESFKLYPTNSDIVFIDDDMEHRDIPSNSQFIVSVESFSHNSSMLLTALSDIFNEDMVRYFTTYFGIDRGSPRSIDELAERENLSKSSAREIARYLEDVIAHPKYRIALRNAIFQLDGI